MITPKQSAKGKRRMKMNDIQMIVDMMVKDGLDYHVINDVLMLASMMVNIG